MNGKIIKKCSMISFILILAYLLVLIFNPSFSSFIQEILNGMKLFDNGSPLYAGTVHVHVVDGYIPQNTVLILAMLIPTMMLLSYAKKENKPLLKRTSSMSLIAGWVYFAISLLTWIYCIVGDFYLTYLENKYPLKITTQGYIDSSTGTIHYYAERDPMYFEKYEKFSNNERVIMTICSILASIVAVFLLVMFIVSVSRSANKRLQCKAELIKPVTAVLILVFAISYCVRAILSPLFFNTNILDAQTINRIMSSSYTVQIWTHMLIALLGAIFILVFGIIKVKSSDIDPEDIVYVRVENLID